MAAQGRFMGGGLRERLFARYWRRQFRAARDMGAFLAVVRRRQAELAGFAARAEARLAPAPPPPAPGARWSWRPDALLRPLSPAALLRPEPGAALGAGLALHHDAGPGAAFMLAQRKVEGAASRFALAFEAYEFDGAYLSLSLAPPADLPHPRPGEAVRLEIDLAASRPVKAFLRLVVARPGARTEIAEEGELASGRHAFRFAAERAAFPVREDDSLWLDLILDRPRMAALTFRDLSLSLGPA
ncbi:MAG: DUF6478 family protein [Pikeienuella sp.]|uniref:DUF6478 family protein n=1 Tax=Pikeienuella sp. TaxID=2831957 RepID=UPI00391CB103